MVGVIVLLILVGAILAIESDAVQVLIVTSGSMEPTLQIGDRILVDAAGDYGLYSVVVLDDPDHPGEQLVKRIVGLGGDRVEVRDGILYLNGKEQYSTHVSSNEIYWRNTKLRVPDDHVFVLGDNRNDSYDSLNFGPVPVDNVTGVLSFIIWPSGNWGRIPNFMS